MNEHEEPKDSTKRRYDEISNGRLDNRVVQEFSAAETGTPVARANKLQAEKVTVIAIETQTESREKGIVAGDMNLADEKDRQLAAMKKQLEATMLALADEREKVVARDKAIAERDNAIAEEREKVAVRDNVIADMGKVIAEGKAKTYTNSMERLIHEPPMFTLAKAGSCSSNTGSSNHHHATGKEWSIVLETLDKTMFSQNDLDKSSRLLRHFSADKNWKYSTEADIAFLVQNALLDSIDLVNAVTGASLAVRQEVSLFSQRPDHLVVFDEKMDAPVLIVEDKKPTEDLSTKPHVRGQMYDYLVAMKAFGNSAPFAVLTSFQESNMVWLDDDESNKIARMRGSRLSKDDTCLKCITNSVSVEKSPSPLKYDESSYPRQQRLRNNKLIIKRESKKSDRTIMHSGQYGSNKIVPLLFTSIICGLIRNPVVPKKTLKRPAMGYKGHALKLMVGRKTAYSWVSYELEVQNHLRPTRVLRSALIKEHFLATDIIGMGSTSKVFIASDMNGRECVLKMYVKRFDDNGTYLETKDFDQIARSKTKDEVTALQEAYPLLKEEIYVKQLSGLWSVIMPLFKPIPKKKRNDPSILAGITGALHDLCRTLKKKHKDEDIRWRHVGMYETKFVLFDLADLIDLERDEEDIVVSHYITTLKNRAQIEE